MDREARLAEVVTAFLKAAEAGERPDPAEWLARHPDLAPELGEFFAGQKQLDGLAAPLRLPALPRLSAAFGDYELLEEIGRGGMGVVYKARQKSLGRVVALKMIASAVLTPADVERFRHEAQASALLHHPHIVPIYDVGEYQGHPYYTMKLFEGGDLSRHLERFRARPVPAAELVATIAGAVHHAHQRGILHRDLKPSNILLDEKGWPAVADFGLARRVEQAGSLTQTGLVVGTLGYMAPEQAVARKQLTTAADVYGLGAILYALLTGQPPFVADTPEATLRGLAERVPVPPRRLNGNVDRDLETICLKCLDANPSRRYESAQALADDLRRYRRGEPIHARRLGPLARVARWVRRRPAVAALLVAVAAVAALGVAGVFWKAGQVADALAQLAQTQEQVNQGTHDLADARQRFQETMEVEQQKLESVRRGRRAADMADRVRQAERAWAAGDLGRAQEFLDACPPETRGWDCHYLRCRTFDRQREAWELRGFRWNHEHLMRDFVYVSGLPFTRPARLREVALPVTDGYLTALSADGRRMAVARYEKGYGQPFQAGGIVTTLAGGNGFTALPDLLLTAPRERNTVVEVWDTDTGARLCAVRAHCWPVVNLALSPDGERVVSVSVSPVTEPSHWYGRSRELRPIGRPGNQMLLLLTDATTGRVLASRDHHLNGLRQWNWNWVNGDWDGAELEFVLNGGRLGYLRDEELPREGVSPDWMKLYYAVYGQWGPPQLPDDTRNDTASGLDPQSGKPRAPRWEDEWRLASFPTAPNVTRRLLAAVNRDRSVLVMGRVRYDTLQVATLPREKPDPAKSKWDERIPVSVVPRVEDGKGHWDLYGNPPGITALAVSPDGTWYAAGHEAGMVSISEKGCILSVRPGHAGRVSAVSFSLDGRRVFSGGADGAVRVWDVETGLELLRLDAGGPVLALVARPDGRTLTAVREGPAAVHWTAEPVPAPFVLRGADDHHGLAMGGRYLAGIDGDRAEDRLTVWDRHTGAVGASVAGRPTRHDKSSPQRFALATGGTRLAYLDSEAGEKGVQVTTLRMCEVPGGRELWRVKPPFWNVTRLALSADGRRVALLGVTSEEEPWSGRLGEPWRKEPGHWTSYPRLHLAVLDGATGAEVSRGTVEAAPDADTFHLCLDPAGEQVAVFGTIRLPVSDKNYADHDKFGIVQVHDARTGAVRFTFTGSPDKPFAGNGWPRNPGDKEMLNAAGIGRDHGNRVSRAAFSPDGKRLAATASGDWWVKCWDLDTGREVLSVTEFRDPDERKPVQFSGARVLGLEFTDDGALRALLTPYDHNIQLRDLTNGRKLQEIPNWCWPDREWWYGETYYHGGVLALPRGRKVELWDLRPPEER